MDDSGIGILLRTRQLKKMISFNVGGERRCMRPDLVGELEVQKG